MADFLLSPGELAAVTSVASVIGGFFAKFAWDRWWKKKDAAEAALQATKEELLSKQITGVVSAINNLAEKVDGELRSIVSKMDAGFGEVRGLINKQDVVISKIQMQLEHEKEQREKLETKLDAMPDLITKSRHALRNQLWRELMHDRRMQAAGVKHNPLTDPLPPELNPDDDKPTEG